MTNTILAIFLAAVSLFGLAMIAASALTAQASVRGRFGMMSLFVGLGAVAFWIGVTVYCAYAALSLLGVL